MCSRSAKNGVTMQEIWEAKSRIKPIVKETPLIQSSILKEKMDASVYLKLENLHEIGAFKVRGAANKMSSLTDEEKAHGVTTFSTGNHGLAVAYVAKQLGIRAVICISNRVPDAKVHAIEQLEAEVVKVGESQDEAEKYCQKLEKTEKLTIIKPFDDPFVIAGQGTIGIELIEKVPAIDAAIIPLSGGGLFAGIGLALKAYNPDVKLIGVSMEKSAVMAESLKAGKPVILPESDTLADSLLGGIGLNNEYTFSLVRDLIDEMIHVSEAEIAAGMAFILDQHRMVVEGAAAAGVAAMLSNKCNINAQHIATIVTGNNVNTSVVSDVLYNQLNNPVIRW
ncbi:hydroxyectoine utilization dehydratase EutB [Virgibacillus sp. W0181]|uniref:hydroxyectoine utilization dehydratase EutB n=1 Tax=Virgibacillus sp. W0181 TaxID=3391581 RepID=UPI003F46C109